QITKEEYEILGKAQKQTAIAPSTSKETSVISQKYPPLISLCDVHETKNNIYDGLKRKSFRVKIPKKLNKDELHSIASAIVESTSKKSDIDALLIVFDFIDNKGSHFSGNAVWAPGGEWDTPDTSQPHKLTITTQADSKDNINQVPVASYTPKTSAPSKSIKQPNQTGKPGTATTGIQTNPIGMIDRNTAYSDLKNHLLKKYPASYSTVELLLNSGMDDYDSMCQIPPDTINNQILSKLSDKYYPSFSTIFLLYKANKKSYDNLNR
ncbi:MAG: hypothetical protein WA151_16180, partial [Desulfatirhabdiaceae bacterium]